MADPPFDEMLWDLVVAQSTRGMDELREHLPADPFTAAAQCLLGKAQPVVIGTGFPVGGAPETDGPPGAFALADALIALDQPVSIATWPEAAAIFGRVRPDLDYVPVGRGDASSPPFTPSHAFVAIEVCGVCADGTYRNMRHVDISDGAPRFEAMFGTHAAIAIGDGGNEFGMGELPVEFVERWNLCRPVSTCDHLLPGATSNFAAYALVAALERVSGERLLPEPDAHVETIRALVQAGCVDGVTGARSEKVDGLPLEATAHILEALT